MVCMNHPRQSRSKGKRKKIKLRFNSLFFLLVLAALVWIASVQHIYCIVHNSTNRIDIFNDDHVRLPQSIDRNEKRDHHSTENSYHRVKSDGNSNKNIHLIRPPIRNSNTANNGTLHFYFINLDVSTDRAMALTHSFANLSFQPQSSFQLHRVPAVTTNEVKELYKNGSLYFKQIEDPLQQDDNIETRETKLIERARTFGDYNTFTYNEVACTLSHLRAIKQAYDDGHEMAIILEDDALISQDFVDNWESYAAQAPSDWQILQWITNNIRANKRALHGHNDFWMSWRCYFWGTAFYSIRREGMERLIDASFAKTGTGLAHRSNTSHFVQWIFSEPQVVTSDSLVYYLTKTYTSTYPWITLQNCSSTIMHGFREDYTFGKSSIASPPPKLTEGQIVAMQRPESIAIVMNLRLKDIASSTDEMNRLKIDVETFSKIHPHSRWFVKIVLVDESLKPFVEDMLSSYFPRSGIGSMVDIHLEVNIDRFNKFAFLRTIINEVVQVYEFVLLKDNDIPVAGFEWNTFMDAKGNSTLSSPFYETSEDWLERNSIKRYDSSQRVNLQHAAVFNKYDDESYASPLEPISTMFLEMKFVLVKADFAYWFFSQLFQAEFFMNQYISWGVDLMWCGAAYQYNMNHDNRNVNACSIVPLNILDIDTRQIPKTGDFYVAGEALVKRFRNDPRFSSWFSQSDLTLRPKTYTALRLRGICKQFDRTIRTMSQCGRVIHAKLVKDQGGALNLKNIVKFTWLKLKTAVSSIIHAH